MVSFKSRRALLGAALAVTTALGGLAAFGLAPMTAQAEAPAAAPRIGAWGFDIAGMDTSVKPGDDFFTYAGGNWMKANPIPADRSRWGSFDVLDDQADKDTRAIIEDVAKQENAPGSIPQKIADYYKAYMDEAAIEAAGLTAIQGDLDAIAALSTTGEVAAFMADPNRPGNAPIGMGIGLDEKDPNNYSVDIGQGGLGLPDRDFYLKDEERFKTIRAAYEAYIAKMLGLAGIAEPEAKAKSIVALETKIAEIHWPREKRRNRDLTYNPKTREELKAFAPGFDWDAAFASYGIPAGQDKFILSEADAVQGLAKMFGETPVEDWKTYLTFHTLRGYAALLPKAFDDANFDFYGRTLNGQEQQRDRWKRAVDATSGALGEAIGQIYVERHFPESSKKMMVELVENLRTVWKGRIEALDWMGADTKKMAIEKLMAMRVKVGYPDKWRDYSALEVKADDPVGNAKRAALFEHNRDLARLGKPTDRDEWYMAPQTVNAYYNPVFNEIVFPAAILQAPFFDPNADPAINYGGIGGVIGHEIGHGFDDQGSKSDAQGVLRDWWTPEDKANFEAKSAALADQFSQFEPLPGLKMNGRLTLGENSADLAGLTVAFEAYKLSLGGQEAPVLDGFTGEQRVFLGWSQVWRNNVREEALKNSLPTAVHSPGRFRTLGPLRNIDAWYKAFNIESGAMAVPEDQRVRIW
jgi:putative endopeptidase